MSEVHTEIGSDRPIQADVQRVALGVSDEIAAIEQLTDNDLIVLGEGGIKSLDDLADLAGYELLEILGGEHLTEEAANGIIMAARAHWFEGDEG